MSLVPIEEAAARSGIAVDDLDQLIVSGDVGLHVGQLVDLDELLALLGGATARPLPGDAP